MNPEEIKAAVRKAMADQKAGKHSKNGWQFPVRDMAMRFFDIAVDETEDTSFLVSLETFVESTLYTSESKRVWRVFIVRSMKAEAA